MLGRLQRRRAAATALALALAGCGPPPRAPERCRNLVQNPSWENHAAGWNIPPFARLEEDPAGAVRSLVVEGHADGAIAQRIRKPEGLSGLGVIAVGYARVETPHPIAANDDDATPQLWDGAVALVNGYERRWGGFASPHTQLRFTGREVAAGEWKRFVTTAIPVRGARSLYPHFAFWQTRLAAGVKIHLAALSLVEAPAADEGTPEPWVACPALPAPSPVLESVTRRQWAEDLQPNGAFEDSFAARERAVGGEPGWRELLLTARYRQGSSVADRFLISITEDGSDPRLSPTSRIQTVTARRGVEQWETAVRVRKDAGRLRIAVAAAAATASGLRAQTPLLPAAWQSPAP